MSGAWCKAAAVGESVARDVAAAKKGKAGGKKAMAAATAAADAARREADKAAAKWQDGRRHRKLFAEAWLAFLRTPFPSDIYRKVLTRMHSCVMPHMPNPLLLSDFCTASIDRGGLDGMLALNGIFVLMTQHSLEYPQFYNRLYQLLDASAFHVNNRKGFFELLDIFLRSPALPAYLAVREKKRKKKMSPSSPSRPKTSLSPSMCSRFEDDNKSLCSISQSLRVSVETSRAAEELVLFD